MTCLFKEITVLGLDSLRKQGGQWKQGGFLYSIVIIQVKEESALHQGADSRYDKKWICLMVQLIQFADSLITGVREKSDVK